MSTAEKRLVVLSLFLRTFLVGLDIVGLGLLGISVSLASGSVIAPGSLTANIIDALAGLGGHNFYAVIAGASVLFFLAKGAAAMVLNFQISKRLARHQAQRASATLDRIVNSNLELIDRWSPVEIAHGLGGAMDDAFGRLITATTIAYGEAILIAGVSSFLIYTSPILFLFMAMFFTLVGMVLFVATNLKTRRLSSIVSETTVESANTVIEALANFKQIFTLGVVDAIVSSFLRTRTKMAESQERLTTYSSLPRYIIEMAMMCGVGLLLLERTSSLSQSIPASVVAMFIGGALRMAASLLPLQGAYAMILHATSSAKISLDILRTVSSVPPPASEQTGSETTESLQLKLEFRNVSYKYPNSERLALESIDLSVVPGDFLAIVGPSGAGKSTLADLALGLRAPTSGQVLIAGIDAHTFVSNNPGRVAYVPQRTNLISGTVVDNVALGVPKSQVDLYEVRQALEKVQLLNVIEQLPDGLHSEMGKAGNSLSGGQIQRIGLARALYRKPSLLVLDEATSALDDATEIAVQQAINAIGPSTALIVIAHKLSTLSMASKGLRIEGGRAERFNPSTEFRNRTDIGGFDFSSPS